METSIIDYTVAEFFSLNDEKLIGEYLVWLPELRPIKQVVNPNYKILKWYQFNQKKKQKWIPKSFELKPISSLRFGEVTNIRNYFNKGNLESLFKAIKVLINVTDKEILNFTITQFYGIISFIKAELIQLTNEEIKILVDDRNNEIEDAVKAKERMSIFGELNIINSLAQDDILRWNAIQKLPYLEVRTKLWMDKIKYNIQQDIAEYQRKKTQN